ncbi:ATP-binding protein [Nanoarchaeota archaeon]
MKKRCLVLIVLLSILFSIGVVAAQQPAVIKAGVYDNYPKIFLDDAGRPAGIWIDILEDIATKEGWNLEYTTCDWNECLTKLENNEIQIMPDVAVSEERKQRFRFNNEVVIVNWGEVYTQDSIHAESFFDLDGKRIAVLNGSIHTDGPRGVKNIFETFILTAEFIPVESYDQVFELVDTGAADAGIANRLFGALNMDKYSNIKRSTIIFNPVDITFAFNKENPYSDQLIEGADRNLKALKADENSIYYSTLNKYLSQFTKVEVFPQWAKIALIALAVLIAGFLVIIFVMKQYQKTLQNTVSKRTAELEEAVKKLKGLDIIKASIIRNVSHELRTPITIAQSAMKLAERLNKKEERAKFFIMARNAFDRQDKIIDDLIEVARLENKEMSLKVEKVNLQDVIDLAVGETKNKIDSKNMKLEVNAADVRVNANFSMIKTVVTNLLDNAVKFSDTGGKILLDVKEKADCVEVSIADTGIGIPREFQEKIFERFYQGDPSFTRQQGGTGIGLAITKEIVEAHGGKVWVHTKPKKGSTFYFSLPRRS